MILRFIFNIIFIFFYNIFYCCLCLCNLYLKLYLQCNLYGLIYLLSKQFFCRLAFLQLWLQLDNFSFTLYEREKSQETIQPTRISFCLLPIQTPCTPFKLEHNVIKSGGIFDGKILLFFI